MMMPWKKRKLIRQLTGSFGKDPEKDYYAGDMDWIRTYFDLCRAEGRDPFYLDETTWKDLDLEAKTKALMEKRERESKMQLDLFGM